jgi:hypothetical protein
MKDLTKLSIGLQISGGILAIVIILLLILVKIQPPKKSLKSIKN